MTLLLGLLVSFAPMTIDLYVPALPLMTRDLMTDAESMQLTLSVYMVGFAISQTFFGPISDRFGRRPTILAGTSLYLVASVACALATSIEQLIAFRLFQSVGAAAAPVVARAVVRDLFTREEAARMYSVVTTVVAIAPVIAPVLGGFIVEWLGWRANFWLLTGFGVNGMLLVLLLLPETNKALDPTATRVGRMLANFTTMLSSRAYRGYVLTVMGNFSGLFAYLLGASFVLVDRLGMSPTAFGLSFGGASVGFMSGAFLGSRVVRRVGIEQMCMMGTFCAAAGGMLVFALIWSDVVTIWSIIIPTVIYFIGMGLSQPNIQAGAISPFPHMAGAAASLLGLAQYSSGGVLFALLGLFAFDPTLLLATVMGISGVFAFTVFTVMIWLPLKRGT
ncbi:MAG: Bcr/CflA family drug resistance efflux transporter [Alphaproteobacteria bacterium]|nr:Bcr/CflA family drug resistance efflux transporter [Alphaproteobacteria bacterium]|tara:strand:- start:303 stop:1475 length:1173 start_codon:yes stop_codon:yes gene_type:complete